jgi:hypothetical protein
LCPRGRSSGGRAVGQRERADVGRRLVDLLLRDELQIEEAGEKRGEGTISARCLTKRGSRRPTLVTLPIAIVLPSSRRVKRPSWG